MLMLSAPSAGLGGFQIVGNVAEPDDLTTLGVFQGLQRFLNFAAEPPVFMSKLAEDGRIGSLTLQRAARINQLMEDDPTMFFDGGPISAAILAPFLSSISTLAAGAEFVTREFSRRMGIAPDFTPNPTKRPAGSPALPPGPGTLPSLTPSVPRKIGVGTMVIFGLLSLATLGTIVWFVRRK